MKTKAILWTTFALLLSAILSLPLLLTGCGSHPDWEPKAANERAAQSRLSPTRGMDMFQAAPGSVNNPPVGREMSPVSFSQPGEELWIIAKPQVPAVKPVGSFTQSPADLATTGTLAIEEPIDPHQPDGAKRYIPVPLKHTDVKAAVTAYIATVDVTQQFQNPFDSKIEAVYVFPLPENAAVNEFVMTIGERKIRGLIKEREEAEKIYYEARRQGFNAALLTQERPNIFTQRVANIEPGKAIDIHIRYFHTLAYADGWYQWHFPMVVGPRYNPADTSAAGTGIGAVGRGQAGGPGTSGQRTEIEYLKPAERSGHDIAIDLSLDSGVKIEELVSHSHQIKHTPLEGGQIKITLDEQDRIPNKDFVVQWRVAGKEIKSNLLVHTDARGGYFTLLLYPPHELTYLPRQPMEMVFVLDCSGSMSGYPIEKSKDAIRHALKTMNGEDTFQVINFSNSARQLGNAPLAVNDRNVQKALAYVDSLKGEGGTEMITGIKAALDFPQSEGRQRVVAFLTDGYIGNENDILEAMSKRMNSARVFSFGIGSSVNRHLIESMARVGKGAVAYVGPNDDGAEIMDHFFNRISHPALMDIDLDFGSMQVADVFPKRIPDLFVGRPVLMVGRFTGPVPSTIRVRGMAGQEQIAMDVAVQTVNPAPSAVVAGNGIGGIPSVWARMQIQDLADHMAVNRNAQGELSGEVKRIALEYSLMSDYTAFIAVDSSRRTEGGSGTTVNVPVPVPQGVKYETTVKED
ncbi:MAG: VIT domain-containing protein [Phycisphaeraceae bacterium]